MQMRRPKVRVEAQRSVIKDVGWICWNLWGLLWSSRVPHDSAGLENDALYVQFEPHGETQGLISPDEKTLSINRLKAMLPPKTSSQNQLGGSQCPNLLTRLVHRLSLFEFKKVWKLLPLGRELAWV
jgi:hypothetical protein